MAERATDANEETCFEDANDVIGCVDDDDNWFGFVFEKGDAICTPPGKQVFTILTA